MTGSKAGFGLGVGAGINRPVVMPARVPRAGFGLGLGAGLNRPAVMLAPMSTFGFDGGDYGVKLSGTDLPTGGDPRTIVLWYKRNNGSGQYVLSMGNGGTSEFQFYHWTSVRIACLVNGSSANHVYWNITAQTLGTWRHYVMTYGGADDYKLAMNGGSLLSPNVFGGTRPNPLTAPINRIYVGANQDGSTGMTGALAQVAIYTGAWNQDDVDNYWATLPINLNKFTTSGPTLKAYYRGFADHGQGQILTDEAGSNDMQRGSTDGPDANDFTFEEPFHSLTPEGPV